MVTMNVIAHRPSRKTGRVVIVEDNRCARLTETKKLMIAMNGTARRCNGFPNNKLPEKCPAAPAMLNTIRPKKTDGQCSPTP